MSLFGVHYVDYVVFRFFYGWVERSLVRCWKGLKFCILVLYLVFYIRDLV